MDAVREQFGLNLRSQRERVGLSQEALADRAIWTARRSACWSAASASRAWTRSSGWRAAWSCPRRLSFCTTSAERRAAGLARLGAQPSPETFHLRPSLSSETAYAVGLAFVDAPDLSGGAACPGGHLHRPNADFEVADLGELAFDRLFAALGAAEPRHDRGGEVIGADLLLFGGGGVALEVGDRLRDFVLARP